MLEEKYKEFNAKVLFKDDPDFDVTLVIDLNDMPETKKINETMEEAEAEAEAEVIRQENDLIRIKRKDLIEPIAEILSELKKDFITAPIRLAISFFTHYCCEYNIIP